MTVPKLRFPRFLGEWKSKNLGQLCIFYKGKSINKDQLTEEGSDCILYGELYTCYSEVIETVHSKTKVQVSDSFLGRSNDILIPSSGETALDIARAHALRVDNVLIGGDISILRPFENDARFLAYQLSGVRKLDLAKRAQGASVVHLYGSALKKILVKIPSPEEQGCIVRILGLVDKLAVLQQRKLNALKVYKRGLGSVLIDRRSTQERIRLGSVALLKNGYAFQSTSYEAAGTYSVITIANITEDSVFAQSERTNRISTLPADIRPHQILKQNDLLVTLTGNVGRTAKNAHPNNLLNQRVGLLDIHGMNPECLFQLLRISSFKADMISAGQGAAQKNISKGDIENFKLPKLTESEQISIAAILSSLDFLISKAAKKANCLQRLKRNLLKQLFV